MDNVAKIRFQNISDGNGSLIPIESERDIPFAVKRVYCITGVPAGIARGFHAHRNLHQVLICLNGSVTIKVETPLEIKNYILDSPFSGLYIGTLVWREMYDFSPGAVLMVLASDYYSENDYIRNHQEYIQIARRFFGCEEPI